MIRIFIYGIFLLLIPVFFIYGKNVPFSDQKAILDSLKDTASIIFAILGAWIAVIYPKDLQKIFKQKTDGEKEEELVFEKLIYSLILITTVLIIMIISLPIINLIKNIEYFAQYKVSLRRALLVYIYLIALIQAHALFVTLMPNIKILIDMISARNQREIQERNSPVRHKIEK
ncbi:TPA: hypothetical protein JI093_12395 [Acinetobacter baumannii]|nr:hypothetical protein [Acinetobacter baumannii]